MLRLLELRDVAGVDALARSCGLTLDARHELGLEHSELWVSEEGGAIVGFVLGWFVADELEIVDIAVDPGVRRTGQGRRLLERLLARARARGALWAFLEVRAGNAAAQGLYLRHGFVRHAVRPRYYGDGEDAWLFRCCLAEAPGTDSP